MTREWYFQAMGQELGPLSVAELKAKVANGQIQYDTFVRKGAEGRWVTADKVKGLIPVPEEPPPPPPPPPVNRPSSGKSSHTMPVVTTKPSGTMKLVGDEDEPQSKAASNGSTVPRAEPTKATFVPLSSLTDDEAASKPPSVAFYDFVGFREAITPVLYDAIMAFAEQRGMSISQINRRSLAEYIGRPELASDLMITAVSVIPQQVNAKSNQDGSDPLKPKEQDELATFRFTVFNSSAKSIHLEEGVFLPETVDVRDFDTVDLGEVAALDHAGHVPVSLEGLQPGKAIRLILDVLVPPQQTKDITVWFHSPSKPSFTKVRGQLLVGQGGELAMSEYFQVLLHGDSPSGASV